jgi:hypothetical protein
MPEEKLDIKAAGQRDKKWLDDVAVAIVSLTGLLPAADIDMEAVQTFLDLAFNFCIKGRIYVINKAGEARPEKKAHTDWSKVGLPSTKL